MKVERKKTFEPVLITLETEDELAAIRNLLGEYIQGSPRWPDSESELFIQQTYDELLRV